MAVPDTADDLEYQTPLSPMYPLHSFSSALEAYEYLESLWNFCIRSQNERANTEFCALLYEQWSSSFCLFLQDCGGNQDVLESQRLLILQVRGLNIHFDVLQRGFRTRHEVEWDAHHDKFLAMHSFAQQIAANSAKSAPGGTSSPFSLDGGLIRPLFKVALRCRHPEVRRQVIATIKDLARREGAMNGSLVARIAERIVELEEDSLTNVRSYKDVPEMSRVFNVVIEFPTW